MAKLLVRKIVGIVLQTYTDLATILVLYTVEEASRIILDLSLLLVRYPAWRVETVRRRLRQSTMQTGQPCNSLKIATEIKSGINSTRPLSDSFHKFHL